MADQPLRGNPEVKQVRMNTGFSGGMNVTYADDLIPPAMLRNIVNYNLESIGELTVRRGFGKNSALTEVLYDNGEYHNELVNLATQTEVFFTLLNNEASVWHRLAESKDLNDFYTHYGTDKSFRYLRFFVNADKSLYWEDVTVDVTNPVAITIVDGTINQASFTINDNLMNWEYVDKYGRLYFTNNDKGLLIFDAEADNPAEPFTFAGEFTGLTNEAYKPNGIEVRKIGFNILGTDPLTWVYESELTTETIQGVYLTTAERKPIKIIPGGSAFQVNILYTGDTYAFTLGMNVMEDPVDITFTKNTTLSVDGSLAVYDVTLKTQPTGEVELVINFDSDTVEVETYYDYYLVGTIPEDAELVDSLNVGEFKIVEMYDRLVYYKGNAIWFSEVDVYDYIPNFNYVLVPLDKTDEITRIIFFRDNYIVFTKRRIYKLTGDFEQAVFNLDKVNDKIGCIAPHTPMVIDNQMLFVSTIGLRALKTDTFKEDLENIKEFDEAIYPLIITSERMWAYSYKNQYILNTYNKGNVNIIEANMREYREPDQIRFYYQQGAFVTDIYAKDAYVKFMFDENGSYYSFRSDGLYRMDDGYSDFGKAYNTIAETSALNFGFPAHEKKVKHVILKAGGGSVKQAIKLQLAADGEVVVSSDMYPTGANENGVVVYTDMSPEIDISEPFENTFGEGLTKYHTKKFRAAAKGRNIALRVIAKSVDRLNIQAIGFIWKLGKVRG